jgi:Flp pilus assembly protein TadB
MLPGLILGAEQVRQVRLRRLEGVATWVESLVATLSGAAGLEQAIITTASTAPAPIRPHVTAMAAALRGGVRLPDVLRGFARDVADPFADTVAASLLLASTQGAGRLADPLTLLAAAVRDEVAAQRRVERGRAKAATDARLIIAATLVMAVGLVVFNRGYLRPYDSVTGQVVLAVVGVLFAAGFLWLTRLARPRDLPRVLDLSGEVGR